ncbi:N-6 DNA methylase [Thermococcus alcaliphilus]|uniref:N-6 DNA methylase n=1 Tax=Thermococcus alcaliphilus TaxID=139207 RepID=UPI0020911287|nr:N-6 DNA methylase [Thermococcus alcaliphilus]MCO6041631.1 SAM-dependent methyltransferase [Thermococcus alcaliphilus]
MGRVKKGKVTERSLYTPMVKVFERHGGKGISEISYKSVPDLIVEWLGEKWIVSVKIGDPLKRAKLVIDAILQYQDHVRDTGIEYGMIVFFPEEVRKISPYDQDALENFVETAPTYVLVMNPSMEIRDSFSNVLYEIRKAIEKNIPTTFPLSTVLAVLKEHVMSIMDSIKLTETEITRIITNEELFFGISGKAKKEEVFRFLATYIFLSQVLFLRLYSVEHPTITKGVDLRKVDKKTAQTLFDRILEINYKPIFELNVLEVIPEQYVEDTFKLIWGLKVEKIRYELPGRLFHELMPEKIRKLLAAFYTRPIAADLLAQLTIEDENATVFDPACGSGTILTAAYKRKLELWKKKGKRGDPHKKFCEQQIYGADIMPFSVHLAGANLAAMNPGITINKVQIALGDSLKLSPDTRIKPGYRSIMEFVNVRKGGQQNQAKAFEVNGAAYNILLPHMDVVLMNPPFTKIERGIKRYVDLERFRDVVGGEVGLWGHFIALADVFLKEGGTFGGVIPISILRGRETKKVRELVFTKWLPLYIIKSTINYGFSEWSEYRDVLIIAKKVDPKKRPKNHKVKFCLIKKNLNKLTEEDVKRIAETIKKEERYRSSDLDIDAHTLEEIERHFENLMVFISGATLDGKDALVNIISKANKKLLKFPEGYFKEGYRFSGGSSNILTITRNIGEGRTDQAFLILRKETPNEIVASTSAGVAEFRMKREHFVPALRTPVGLDTMDITGKHDYMAKESYEHFDEIVKLSGYKGKTDKKFWESVRRAIERNSTNTVMTRRINPFSPNQKLVAFYSEEKIVPADQLKIITEENPKRAKAMVVLMNSIFFLANFFNSKEETTGRFVDIRGPDLYSMRLYPPEEYVENLVKVFDKYKDKEFPALTKQISEEFEERYEQFWIAERKNQAVLEFAVIPYRPNKLRLEFDMDVAVALGIELSEDELLKAYKAIEADMIATRGLRRD